MLHTLKWIFSILLLFGTAGFVSGCASPSAKAPSKKEKKNSFEEVFLYSMDDVWRASQIVLRYPLARNDMDAGIIETDWIPADEGFIPPDQSRDSFRSGQYMISLKVSKGTRGKKPAIRVKVEKIFQKTPDFFSEPKMLQSDGLEEQVLLYRIQRELLIAEGLKKAQASGKL